MFFFFKQKTAYEMRISDWSSDVCSSDLKTQRINRKVGMADRVRQIVLDIRMSHDRVAGRIAQRCPCLDPAIGKLEESIARNQRFETRTLLPIGHPQVRVCDRQPAIGVAPVSIALGNVQRNGAKRSEETPSELQ